MISRLLSTLFILILSIAGTLRGQQLQLQKANEPWLVLAPDDKVERPWVFSAGGGAVVPVHPDYFAGQWKTGYTIVGGIDYMLTSSIAIGGSFDRSVFPHTGKSLRFRDQPFQCMGGGTRSFTTTGLRMRVYLNSNSPFRFSLSGGFGFMDIFREDVLYHADGFTLTIPSESSLHVSGSVNAGLEYPVAPNLNAALEAGYMIGEDGIWINHHIPITASLRYRL